MPERIKYPLTPEAKAAAKALVEAWDQGNIQQSIELIDVTSMGDIKREFSITMGSVVNTFDPLELSIIRELSEYRLISVKDVPVMRNDGVFNTRLEVTLLHELRNAVQNNFVVSDYFLTLNAVGTIVYGNLEVKEGAMFQSAAASQGNIIQNTGQLADQLEALLGDDVLAQQEQLKIAIHELRQVDGNTDENTRLQKAGNVIAELGRGIGHIGKTGAAIQAIMLIARLLNGG